MIPGVGEFRHAVRKGGPTRNPFTNERYECPPRDVLKFKVAKKLRTDYYVAVRDGIVPSNTPNGFQQSRKLTAEEIKELGYKKPAPPHRAYMRCKAKAQGIEYNPNDYGANYDVVYDTEEYERRKKEGTLYGDKTSTGDAVTDNGTQTN